MPLNLLTIIFALTTVCCSSQNSTEPTRDVADRSERILIVYLSRTNNTKAIAKIIHEKVGGDLVALELVNPYPEDYKTVVAQVAKENETGFLPPLRTKINNMQTYEVVFVGFPTWGMQLPPPVKSFLNQYNLSGKTVIPFNTNGGYGVGNSFSIVKKLCPDSEVVEGFSTKGGVERDGILFVMEGEKEKEARLGIEQWLRKIKMIK